MLSEKEITTILKLSYNILNPNINILKNDKYHGVFLVIDGNEEYILKKINKYNIFLVDNFELFINVSIITLDLIKSSIGEYIYIYNNDFFILYKKIKGNRLLDINHFDIRFLYHLKEWHSRFFYNNIKYNVNDYYKNKVIHIKENIKYFYRNLNIFNYNKIIINYLYYIKLYIGLLKNTDIGIIHDNISLENILLTKDGSFKLVDFDTLKIGIKLNDVFQYIASGLIYGVNDINLKEIYYFILKEYNLSFEFQDIFLKKTLLEILFEFGIERDNKYFLNNNIDTINNIILVFNKNFNNEL